MQAGGGHLVGMWQCVPFPASPCLTNTVSNEHSRFGPYSLVPKFMRSRVLGYKIEAQRCRDEWLV